MARAKAGERKSRHKYGIDREMMRERGIEEQAQRYARSRIRITQLSTHPVISGRYTRCDGGHCDESGKDRTLHDYSYRSISFFFVLPGFALFIL